MSHGTGGLQKASSQRIGEHTHIKSKENQKWDLENIFK